MSLRYVVVGQAVFASWPGSSAQRGRRRTMARSRTGGRHRAGTRGRRAGVRLLGARRSGGGAEERQAWPDSGPGAVAEVLRVGSERV